MFVDQNYDIVLREQAKEMRARHIRQFSSVPVVMQKEQVDRNLAFNNEELFFMNRIAFRLFKLNGAHMRFENFLEDILTL